MNCPFCGYEFREEEGQAACQGCPVARFCHLLKCPRCGYEMPAEPKFIKALRARRKQDYGTKREG